MTREEFLEELEKYQEQGIEKNEFEARGRLRGRLTYLFDHMQNKESIDQETYDNDMVLRILGKGYDEDAWASNNRRSDDVFAWITDIPEALGEITDLRELTIRYNGVATLPSKLEKLTNLKAFDAAYAPFQGTIPDVVWTWKLEELHLTHTGITYLPENWNGWKYIKELTVSKNELTSIPAELSKAQNLRTLRLDNNQLTSIPAELGNAQNLHGLYLDNNQLTSIPAELGNAQNLHGLYLDNNQLTSIPPELGNAQNLHTLYLNYNQLTSIPAELGNAQNLHDLYLDNNQLPSIPAELGKAQNLRTLNLTANELKSIPWELINTLNLHQNLHTLYLGYNQLTSIPAELGNAQNLYDLYLDNNQLTSIPPELGKAQNLHTLNINHNKLKNIPAELGKAQNLHTLGLRFNQLTSIPAELGKAQNLQTLDLAVNQLTSIPAELGKAQNLHTLNLTRNQLTSIPWELGKAQNLHTLILAANELKSIPSELINTLNLHQNLHMLDLSVNELTSIPAELGNAQNLHMLDLSVNELTSIPAELGNAQNLHTLGLNVNQLTSIPPELGKAQNLHTLNINHNKLKNIPAELGKAQNLHTLGLRFNQLTSIPAELGKAQNLQTLDLAVNQLTSIPAELGKAQNLHTLGLNVNQLTSIPAELGKAQNLHELYLNVNQLTSIPAELGNAKNLLRLEIIENPNIKELPEKIITSQILRKLFLRDTGIVKLPQNISATLEIIGLRTPKEIQDECNSFDTPDERRQEILQDYYTGDDLGYMGVFLKLEHAEHKRVLLRNSSMLRDALLMSSAPVDNSNGKNFSDLVKNTVEFFRRQQNRGGAYDPNDLAEFEKTLPTRREALKWIEENCTDEQDKQYQTAAQKANADLDAKHLKLITHNIDGSYLNSTDHKKILDKQYERDPEALLNKILSIPEIAKERRAKLLQKSSVVKQWLELEEKPKSSSSKDSSNDASAAVFPKPKPKHWNDFAEKVGQGKEANALRAAAQQKAADWEKNFEVILGEWDTDENQRKAVRDARKSGELVLRSGGKPIPTDLWQYLENVTGCTLSGQNLMNLEDRQLLKNVIQEHLQALTTLSLENCDITDLSEIESLLQKSLAKVDVRGNPIPLHWREKMEKQFPGKVQFSEEIEDDFKIILDEYSGENDLEEDVLENREKLVEKIKGYWNEAKTPLPGNHSFEINKKKKNEENDGIQEESDDIRVDRYPDHFLEMIAGEKLESLDLSASLDGSDQQEIDLTPLQHAPHLTKIGLDKNHLQSITGLDPLGGEHGLKKLKSISAEENALRDIPQGFGELNHACTLEIKQNRHLSQEAFIEAKLSNLLHGGSKISTDQQTDITDTTTSMKSSIKSWYMKSEAFDLLEKESQEIQEIDEALSGAEGILDQLNADDVPQENIDALREKVNNLVDRSTKLHELHANQTQVGALLELIDSNPRLQRYFLRHHLMTSALHYGSVDLHPVPDHAEVHMDTAPELKNLKYAVQTGGLAIGLLPIPPTVGKLAKSVLDGFATSVGPLARSGLDLYSGASVQERQHRIASTIPPTELAAHCLSLSLSSTILRAPQLLKPKGVNPGKDRTTDIGKEMKKGLASTKESLEKKLEGTEPSSEMGKKLKEKATELLASDTDTPEELLAQRDASYLISDIAEGKPFDLSPKKPGFAKEMREMPREEKIQKGFEWFCEKTDDPKKAHNPANEELPYKKYLVFTVIPEHEKWGQTIKNVMMGELDTINRLIDQEKDKAKLRGNLEIAESRLKAHDEILLQRDEELKAWKEETRIDIQNRDKEINELGNKIEDFKGELTERGKIIQGLNGSVKTQDEKIKEQDRKLAEYGQEKIRSDQETSTLKEQLRNQEEQLQKQVIESQEQRTTIATQRESIRALKQKHWNTKRTMRNQGMDVDYSDDEEMDFSLKDQKSSQISQATLHAFWQRPTTSQASSSTSQTPLTSQPTLLQRYRAGALSQRETHNNEGTILSAGIGEERDTNPWIESSIQSTPPTTQSLQDEDNVLASTSWSTAPSHANVSHQQDDFLESDETNIWDFPVTKNSSSPQNISSSAEIIPSTTSFTDDVTHAWNTPQGEASSSHTIPPTVPILHDDTLQNLSPTSPWETQATWNNTLAVVDNHFEAEPSSTQPKQPEEAQEQQAEETHGNTRGPLLSWKRFSKSKQDDMQTAEISNSSAPPVNPLQQGEIGHVKRVTESIESQSVKNSAITPFRNLTLPWKKYSNKQSQASSESISEETPAATSSSHISAFDKNVKRIGDDLQSSDVELVNEGDDSRDMQEISERADDLTETLLALHQSVENLGEDARRDAEANIVSIYRSAVAEDIAPSVLGNLRLRSSGDTGAQHILSVLESLPERQSQSESSTSIGSHLGDQRAYGRSQQNEDNRRQDSNDRDAGRNL